MPILRLKTSEEAGQILFPSSASAFGRYIFDRFGNYGIKTQLQIRSKYNGPFGGRIVLFNFFVQTPQRCPFLLVGLDNNN